LDLSNNNAKAALDAGALDSIPQNTLTVILENGNLDSVPANFLKKPSRTYGFEIIEKWHQNSEKWRFPEWK